MTGVNPRFASRVCLQSDELATSEAFAQITINIYIGKMGKKENECTHKLTCGAHTNAATLTQPTKLNFQQIDKRIRKRMKKKVFFLSFTSEYNVFSN